MLFTGVAWRRRRAVGRIATTRRTKDVKIILANPRGFCAGVNMAIDSLERALSLFGTPLYVYHEIVHNRPVVERFKNGRYAAVLVRPSAASTVPL